MRLKRLELLGFKSFADRTVFEFGTDTLTGVVGPNGCGKSNVVDAARWILGEQRPTSMRGKEMTDVIFKGCQSRSSMSVAEGTLVLDNSCGTVDERGPEIAITRRVFKSGEGEYLLDGQRTRLKDVREMLFDTGLGSRGYSVLEQGRIDAVLSANAIERRRIFEEAAGISRYRQRKHETELRLGRVEQDLARLEDVVGELRSRVRSLKIQAGKAERYVAARDEWEVEKTRLVKHQLFSLGGALDACIGGIEVLESRVNELRTEREGSDSDLTVLEEERAGLASNLDRLVAEAGRLAGECRALDERKNQLAVRVTSWEGTARDEEQRAVELAAQLAERTERLEADRARRAELETEMINARGDAERKAAERMEANRSYRELRADAEAQNEVVLGLLHRKTEAANTIRHLEQAAGPAEERYQRVAARLEDSRTQLAEVEAEADRSRASIESTEGAVEVAAREHEGLEASAGRLDTTITELEGERNRVELETTARESAIQSLLDRDRELADLDAGSKALLEAVEAGRGPCGADRLRGLLADHLETDTRSARALDAVLGERSRALVVDGPEGAALLAEWMHEGIEGQAALAVEGGLGKSISLAAPEMLSELGDRVFGRLRDAVRCADNYSAVADALCNDVLLVADLQTAADVVRLAPGWRAVTRSGELVDAVGVVGGTRTLAQGAIGRRSSAAEKREELAVLEAEAAKLDADLTRLRGEREVLRGEQAVAQRALEAARQALVNARSSSVTAEARVKDLRAALANLEHESAGVIEERRRMREQADQAHTVLGEVETEFTRENAALNQLTERRRRVEEERDARIREEGEARVEETRVEQLLAAANRRIEDLERIIQEGTSELERARRLSTESSDSARAGTEENEELARHSAEMLEERARVDEQVRGLREHAAREGQALDELRRRRDVVTRQLEMTGSELSERRLEEQRIALSREEVLRRADEELGLECDGLIDGFEPEADLCVESNLKSLDRSVREMKSQLDRMGPVNMEALGELEEVSGRLEFLEEQIADLQKAKRTLHETIKRIEEESERLFLRTFQEVRGNFQRIFRQLFGGGKADVVLAEGEPILEAGVEISARPPGREMLPIGLLSGGQRTMTALALLFAVFEARPSPFCILDEVDAALDDANIQRFLAMLEGFRSSTQFVVVTHNKGTMGACDSLYGVTMQTKGVSRHVAVQLSEVDEFVPEATGKATSAAPSLLPDADTSDYGRRDPLPDEESDLLEALDREAAESNSVVDEESGEPVVELYPARVEANGEVKGGEAERPRESGTEALLEADENAFTDDAEAEESATGIPLESSAREAQAD